MHLILIRTGVPRRRRLGDVCLSDVVVDALKERGGAPVKYTRDAPGLSPPCVTKAKDLVGHGSYEFAFKEEGLWEWIEAQRRQA